RDFPDIPSLLEGGFTEETARLLYAQGEEIAIFVMMQLAALAMKPNTDLENHHDFQHPVFFQTHRRRFVALLAKIGDDLEALV
ncbi:MAG: hypothetical protein FWC43_13350, partial [Planctomycetaceae bacterium]|nr:hypothetical protein [Planctomycetaceae bacterium]